MLSQSPSSTVESFDSMVVEAPSSPAQDAQEAALTDGTHGPSSPGSWMDAGDAPTSTHVPEHTNLDDTRVRCGDSPAAIEAQGGSEAVGGSGGKGVGPSHDNRNTPMVSSAPTTNDEHTAALGLIELRHTSTSRSTGDSVEISPAAMFRLQKPREISSAPAKLPNVPSLRLIDTHHPASKGKDSCTAPLHSPKDVSSSRDPFSFTLGDTVGSIPSPPPTAGSDPTRILEPTAPTTLGKHPRAQPDFVVEDQARPHAVQKRQHEPSYQAQAGGREAIVRLDKRLAQVKELLDEKAKRHREATASEDILARQVEFLRERVRNFEEEKQAALDMQRRQLRRELRPGLVTMKMNPRVQARVNQLFGSAGSAAGPNAGASTSRVQGRKKTSGSEAAYRVSAEDRSFALGLRCLRRPQTAAPGEDQGATDAPNPLPPMGFFRAPVSYRYAEPGSNEAPTSKAGISKSSTTTMSTTKDSVLSSPMDLNGHDSGEDTEQTEWTEGSAVSTESSDCSTIPP